MRKLWPLLLLLLSGCTFYSWDKVVQPRSAAELKDISPAIYIVIAVFVLILVGCVVRMLLPDAPVKTQERYSPPEPAAGCSWPSRPSLPAPDRPMQT